MLKRKDQKTEGGGRQQEKKPLPAENLPSGPYDGFQDSAVPLFMCFLSVKPTDKTFFLFSLSLMFLQVYFDSLYG